MGRHQFYVYTYMILQFVMLVFSSSDWDGVVVTLADYQALQAIKRGFVDPRGRLGSWNDSGYGACAGNWAGIKCAQGQVIVLELPWRSLGGRISERIGQLSALRKLSLHDNQIGGMIPTSLGLLPNLRGLQLFNNRFSGSIPPSIGTNCLLLQTLDLSNNSLNGVIPSFGIAANSSSRLYRLDLSFNALSGSIPLNLTRSPSLTYIYLQNNNLSGPIPNTWGRTSSKLQTLDLSNNVFSGDFPPSLCNVTSLVQLNLERNRLGNKLPDTIGALRNLSVLDLRRNQFSGHIPKSIGKIPSLTELDLSRNEFTGDIPVSLVDLTNLNSFNVSYNNLSGSVPIPLSRKFNSSSFIGNLDLCGYSISSPCPSPPPSQSPPAGSHGRKLSTKDILLIAAGILIAILGILCCCILFCCLMRSRREATGEKKNDGQTSTTSAATTSKGEKGKMPAVEGGQVEAGGEAGGKLVHFDGPFMFTADDLLCATAEIMGKSTYGTVYKATLEDGNQVAVKRLREKIAKSQKEFEKEVNLLGKIRHPNLLSLRAYYIGPKGEKLLVFDYILRGSLAAYLHARGPDTPIDWLTRMNIVMGIARGLCYLHKNEGIVHGNLTSGNILLDELTNAKIADYGLFRLMTSTANSNVAATAASLGYRAPELAKLKKPNVKTDVYNFGVVMLELLTGKSPSEPTNGMDLPHWVASIVTEEWTNEVFDLELMRDASNTGDELLNTLKLALHCVDPSPTARPDIQQVLQQLEEIKPELSPGSVDDDSHTGDEAV